MFYLIVHGGRDKYSQTYYKEYSFRSQNIVDLL